MSKKVDKNDIQGWLAQHTPDDFLFSTDGPSYRRAIQKAFRSTLSALRPVWEAGLAFYPLWASIGMLYLLYGMTGQHEHWWFFSWLYMLIPPAVIAGLLPWGTYINNLSIKKQKPPEATGPLLALTLLVFCTGAYGLFPNTNDYYQAEQTIPTLGAMHHSIENLQATDRPVTLGNVIRYGPLGKGHCDGVLVETENEQYQCGLDEPEPWTRIPFAQDGFAETTVLGRLVETENRYLLELKKAGPIDIDPDEYRAFRHELQNHPLSVAGYDRSEGRLYINVADR